METLVKSVLYKGCQGPEVSTFQIELKRLGYDIQTDGIFGHQTEKAVLDFQNRNNLYPDGIVGINTMSALLLKKKNSEPTINQLERVLCLGDRGDDVFELQKRLINGLDLKPYQIILMDGHFGINTLEYVKRFQKYFGLYLDGIVGQETWNYLFNAEELKKKKITPEAFAKTADYLGCDVRVVKAVFEVESSGFGFNYDGSPKILFEGHVFWEQLQKIPMTDMEKSGFGLMVQMNPDILYPQWVKTHYKGGIAEYERLRRAKIINKDAALASASWGGFQIMGYHWKQLDIYSIAAFCNMMKENEDRQLDIFGIYIDRFGLKQHLQNRNWAAFAYLYNGAGYYLNNYDKRLQQAYQNA
jgi:hypothetical protein